MLRPLHLYPITGRGFGRGGNPFNNVSFPHNRGFYRGGRGQMGRSGFPNDYGLDNPYPDFHGRQLVGRGCPLDLLLYFILNLLFSLCLNL